MDTKARLNATRAVPRLAPRFWLAFGVLAIGAALAVLRPAGAQDAQASQDQLVSSEDLRELVDQFTDRLLVSCDDALDPVVVPGLRQNAIWTPFAFRHHSGMMNGFEHDAMPSSGRAPRRRLRRSALMASASWWRLATNAGRSGHSWTLRGH